VSAPEDQSHHELVHGLENCERIDANLSALEALWLEIAALFDRSLRCPQETADAFGRLAETLPEIDGLSISAYLVAGVGADEQRQDTGVGGDLGGVPAIERRLLESARQLMDYRCRLNGRRLGLLGMYARSVVAQLDEVIFSFDRAQRRWPSQSYLGDARGLVNELEVRVRPRVPGRARWEDLRRHLRFAEPHDLLEVSRFDWPNVRHAVLNRFGDTFDALDPIEPPAT
jgi:hypothetical protein